MATAQEKLEWITKMVNSGASVVIGNQYKATKFSKAAHLEALKATEKSLYIRRGRHWDCADYSAIKAYK